MYMYEAILFQNNAYVSYIKRKYIWKFILYLYETHTHTHREENKFVFLHTICNVQRQEAKYSQSVTAVVMWYYNSH